MRFQFLLRDSNYFKLFPIYSNFCLGIPIFQLFGTIGEMGCGGARALLPQCQIIGILESPSKNWNLLEIIGNNWNPQTKNGIFNEIPILLGDSNYFQLFPIYSKFCLGIPIFNYLALLGRWGVDELGHSFHGAK